MAPRQSEPLAGRSGCYRIALSHLLKTQPATNNCFRKKIGGPFSSATGSWPLVIPVILVPFQTGADILLDINALGRETVEVDIKQQ